jgi:ferritin-like metal-binding protein YciE
MTTPNDTLISWLNDAYAMEQNLIQVLENHAKDARNHPDIEAKDLEHLEATRRHAEVLRECLDQVGGSVSSAKSAMGSISGFFQGVSTGMAPDEIVKNFLADFAAEHFEIASYNALIAAARAAGRDELIPRFEEILREEQEMADWLRQRLPTVVEEYMMQPSTR